MTIDFSAPDAVINRTTRDLLWQMGAQWMAMALRWGASEVDLINRALEEVWRCQRHGKVVFWKGIVRSVCTKYVRKEQNRGLTFRAGRTIIRDPATGRIVGNAPAPKKPDLTTVPILSWDWLKEERLCVSW